MDKKYIFICGCPRSGTSALCNLLNLHASLCVGMERYYHKILIDHELTPEMFQLPRFLDYQPGDSFHPELPIGDQLRRKFNQATFIGEKLPLLFEHLGLIKNNFPSGSVKVLFIFRDVFAVAESYTARARNHEDHLWRRDQDWREAVPLWNMAIDAYLRYKNDVEILPVSYEQLFCSNNSEGEEIVNEMTNFLGIPPFPEQDMVNIRRDYFARQEIPGKKSHLTPDEILEIKAKANVAALSNIQRIHNG